MPLNPYSKKSDNRVPFFPNYLPKVCKPVIRDKVLLQMVARFRKSRNRNQNSWVLEDRSFIEASIPNLIKEGFVAYI